MNRHVHVVIARTLRYGIDPSADIDTAARELAELAGHQRWLLVRARAVVTRRLSERPSAVGERSRELLDQALLFVADAPMDEVRAVPSWASAPVESSRR